ncbi:kinase-like domain-containing protein [Cokeromyces recurvatus]|uniref:kinase-like domain-containing protein n=1 Tax=Cokeromyces recurvatus TaxID=90255 RepID=UPI002220C111|nr:kinase-like domain-containing protein [Cokeromyces recurvatus]KAI7901055.1 kinase-like domain-containing protein [Cokeromyces recurvatus]
MLGFFNNQKQIHVYETTLCIQQNVLSVFHVIIQGPHSTVSLIRYPFDLLEFHQKIRLYYPKCKIPSPTLDHHHHPSSSRYLKRRSLRDLFTFSRKKSNASKIEKYLERCFQHPIISISSILRDFTSVQREEDRYLNFQHISPSMPAPPIVIDNMAMSNTSSLPLPQTPTLVKSNSTSNEIITPNHSNSKITLDDFHLMKILGKGCMGKVLLVRSKRDNRLYALKSIKKKWILQQKELVHTRTERDILVRLRNQPFLINLNYLFQSSSELFLVLDYCAGGDIATQLSLLSRFSEEKTRFYAAEIVQGLKILHQNNIVYRDLKPENVLIGLDGHIILTDFGLSKIFTENDIINNEENVPYTQTFCGTAEYLAPEILLGEPYTFAVDFWSLGTLIYEMLAGITPFWAETHMDMYKRVLEDPLQFPPHRFDKTIKNFLAGLLEKEAHERLGWGGIQTIEEHPYFKSIDWKQVEERQLKPPSIPTIKSETDISNFDDLFTSMPVCISQLSAIEEDDFEEDPFKGFSFDFTDPLRNKLVTINNNKRAYTCIAGTSTSHQQTNIKTRKRDNTIDNNNKLAEESRAIKKRQTMNTFSSIKQPYSPQIRTSTIIDTTFESSNSTIVKAQTNRNHILIINRNN